ncbi:SoxR reducing system RseC family protein [Thioalkalivibrio sp. ALE11]|uniref:SoxR reducing system RseC family protein n=1 Tax=Thioalkalivibrio sp. ALE11 TaxID=1265494 RepID=UPI00037E682E|nr:SoxR reducing system RseC family protein [Thioalkalivibrio sp. ALE11]
MSDWIEEQGEVLDVDGHTARVRIQRRSTCGSCSARSGCGSGVLSDVLGRKPIEVRVGHSGDLQAGDTVTLGVRDTALVAGALMMYLLPLAGLIGVPALGMALFPGAGEGVLLLAGLGGLGAGLLGVRRWMRQRDAAFRPVVLARQPGSGVVRPVATRAG